MLSISLCIYLFASLSWGANLVAPPFTGPHFVGTTFFEVIDYSRQDPFAPTPQPRDLSCSLFYPINATGSHARPRVGGRECPLAPLLTDKVAANLEMTYIGNTTSANGSLHNIVSAACFNARLDQPNLPLLLFTPGLGATRQLYSDLLMEIASYGWNVVALDHPYETSIVEYPDGRVVYAKNQSNVTPAENIEVRTADLISVLNALSNSTVTSKIPGLDRPGCTKLQTDKVGVLGHSLGGATALRVTANDTRFAVGSNLDGAFWGTEQQIGTDAPFLVFGAQTHNRTNDPSWAETWGNLRNFKRQYAVNGTEHINFADIPLWRQLWGPGFPPSVNAMLGPLNGTRGMAIQRAFLNSLFQRFLKGQNDGLLDGVGADEWPEVTIGV